MELVSLLSPEAIRVLPACTSKKRLFQELGEIIETAHGLPAGIAFDALQAREVLVRPGWAMASPFPMRAPANSLR